MYKEAIVNPGEMIGIITAQSLGEPVSQMNMNSKHSAGKGGGVSSGLNGYPRIEELINHTKDNKIPMMYVYFDDKINEKGSIILVYKDKRIEKNLNHAEEIRKEIIHLALELSGIFLYYHF